MASSARRHLSVLINIIIAITFLILLTNLVLIITLVSRSSSGRPAGAAAGSQSSLAQFSHQTHGHEELQPPPPPLGTSEAAAAAGDDAKLLPGLREIVEQKQCQDMPNRKSYFYQGVCFFLEEESVSWRSASKVCGMFGGELASPHNIRHMEIFYRMSRGTTHTFIGVSRELTPFWAAAGAENGSDVSGLLRMFWGPGAGTDNCVYAAYNHMWPSFLFTHPCHLANSGIAQFLCRYPPTG